MAPNVVDGAAGAVGGEHRVRMPAVIPHGGGGAAAAGKAAAAATPAEKGLNRFAVRGADGEGGQRAGHAGVHLGHRRPARRLRQ